MKAVVNISICKYILAHIWLKIIGWIKFIAIIRDINVYGRRLLRFHQITPIIKIFRTRWKAIKRASKECCKMMLFIFICQLIRSVFDVRNVQWNISALKINELYTKYRYAWKFIEISVVADEPIRGIPQKDLSRNIKYPPSSCNHESDWGLLFVNIPEHWRTLQVKISIRDLAHFGLLVHNNKSDIDKRINRLATKYLIFKSEKKVYQNHFLRSHKKVIAIFLMKWDDFFLHNIFFL